MVRFSSAPPESIIRACDEISDALQRERRAGRCKAPQRRRCGVIVEERQRRRFPPAAAPLRAAARRLAGCVARSLHKTRYARRSRLASRPGGLQRSASLISSQALTGKKVIEGSIPLGACPRIGRGRVPGLEGADARRRDAGDVAAHRRGAPTKQMPLPSRNPKGAWGLDDDRCVARRRRCASTSPPPRALRSPCKPHARDPFEFSDRLLGCELNSNHEFYRGYH